MKDRVGNEHSENNGQFVSQGGDKKKDAPKDTPAEEKRYEEIMGKETIAKEKIASVHIDLTKDNVLPKLNEADLEAIGLKENKNVLVKVSVIERNKVRHPDIQDQDINKIISETLYGATEIFKGNKTKEYCTFAKKIEVSKNKHSIVTVDVDTSKENFEVVHWHYVEESGLKRMKNNIS